MLHLENEKFHIEVENTIGEAANITYNDKDGKGKPTIHVQVGSEDNSGTNSPNLYPAFLAWWIGNLSGDDKYSQDLLKKIVKHCDVDALSSEAKADYFWKLFNNTPDSLKWANLEAS